MPNPIADFPWQYAHLVSDALVRTGQGALHTIVVNGLTTAGDCTVYDGVDATGVPIAILHLDPTTSISVQPITLTYDVEFRTGLFLDFGVGLVADLTVSYM